MNSLCEGCHVTEFEAIVKFFNNNEEALVFLRKHGVLPNTVTCPTCDKPCVLRKDRPTWQCNSKVSVPKTRKRKNCGFATPDYKGTFVEQCHFPVWKLVLFVNSWLRKRFTHEHVAQNLNLSTQTTVNWRSYCSEVTEHFLENQPPIGGPEVIVEIDESKFGKTKYGRGRAVKGIWVFGGIERESKKSFLVPLLEDSRRNADTLIPLIQQYILPGSVIISDEWAAYRNLKEYGYKHLAVNHSKNFVKPKDPEGDTQQIEVHTQNIERLWEDVKSWVLKAGIRKEYYRQYFGRYLFLRKSGTNHQELLHSFFLAAAELYPPQGERKKEEGPPPPPSSSDSDDE